MIFPILIEMQIWDNYSIGVRAKLEDLDPFWKYFGIWVEIVVGRHPRGSGYSHAAEWDVSVKPDMEFHFVLTCRA